MKISPLYRQSFGFSCGPASLLMVLKNIDPTFEMDLRSELDIWRDATLFESKATSGHGLALAALRRGFSAKVITDTDGVGFERRLKEHFPAINMELLMLHFDITKKKAMELGSKEVRGTVTADIIRKELDKGIQPIVLVSTELMNEDDPIPHWVVVTKIGERTATIKNPETGTLQSYALSDFERHLGFQGSTVMVGIQPHRKGIHR